jgi:hypothetical protein
MPIISVQCMLHVTSYCLFVCSMLTLGELPSTFTFFWHNFFRLPLLLLPENVICRWVYSVMCGGMERLSKRLDAMAGNKTLLGA